MALYELKWFLHFKDNKSDKIYGFIESKNLYFKIYGKTNPLTSDIGSIKILFVSNNENENICKRWMRKKIDKGYKKIYEQASYGNFHCGFGSISDVDSIYKNLEASIKPKLVKALLKYS